MGKRELFWCATVPILLWATFVSNFIGWSWRTMTIPDDDFYIETAISNIIGADLPPKQRAQKISAPLLAGC